MKNNVFAISVLFAIFLIGCDDLFDQDDKRRRISLNEVPTQINSFVNLHFEGQTIRSAYLEYERHHDCKDDDNYRNYEDYEYSGGKYEITLSNGTELEFNSSFLLTSAENYSKLPDSLIPESILLYVKSNYPNNVIQEWELEYGHQEVELNNGVELTFNSSGKFLSRK